MHLRQHPAVAAVAVAPVADAVRGEEVFACVVARRSQPDAALANEIVAWCVERLAYYKAPGFIAFVAELPLTSTQKIQRGELRNFDGVAGRAGARHAGAETAAGVKRRGYDGVAVCAPVSVPYRRYSVNSAHWWIGRALHALAQRTGLRPR